MAEDQAVAAQPTEKFQYKSTVEQTGPSARKITVEITAERISDKLETDLKELRTKAQLPGFRPGHAPRKLVEKRFGSDLKKDVCRELVAESYQNVIEELKLQVLGEPEFDQAEKIQLPESGPLSYSFSVELQPEFTMPDMAALTVKKPKVELDESHVDRAVDNLRRQQGTYVPVEDRGAEENDMLLVDLVIKHDGQDVDRRPGVQIALSGQALSGFKIEDLVGKLAGIKAGETRVIDAVAGDNFYKEELRGKALQLEITAKDIRQLRLIELNDEFLQDMGMANIQELRDALKAQLQLRVIAETQAAMHAQVKKFLMDNVQLEVPQKLTERQELMVIRRRNMNLARRGVQSAQLAAKQEDIAQGAKEEGINELKIFFILQKLAADLQVDVKEAELNSHVASLAIQEGMRPEKLRDEMVKSGAMSELYLEMRQQKALDKLLETLTVQEFTAEEMNKDIEGQAPQA